MVVAGSTHISYVVGKGVSRVKNYTQVLDCISRGISEKLSREFIYEGLSGLSITYYNKFSFLGIEFQLQGHCREKINTQAWKDQTDFEFGFIPLSDLHESDSRVINHLQKYCPIEAHRIVAGYGKPNYLGARIKVDTQLNLQMWYQELRDYWDQQLLDFLTFGFPLDFNRNAPLHSRLY